MIHLNWVKLTNAPESWPADGERVFVKVGEKTSIAKCYNRTAMRTFLGTRHNPTHWAPMSCMNLLNNFQLKISGLVICSLIINTAPVTIAKTIKSILAVGVFKTFPTLKQKRFWGSGLWSDGTYYGSAGSVSAEIIKKYIENQKTA